MRVLDILRSVDPAYGGPAETVNKIGSLLQQRHDVEVEVLSLDDPSSPHVGNYPLKVHAVGPSLLTFGYSPRLVKWLKQHAHEYDLISVHGIWCYQSYGAYRALRNSQTPYVLFPHGMLDPYFDQGSILKRLKKMLYWRFFESRSVQGARSVLYTCEEERRLAQSKLQGRANAERVIAYGTGDPTVDLDACKEKFLTAHPELRGKRIVLYLGRLHPKKGLNLLIRAAAKYSMDHPDVVYVVAGPDPAGLRPQLQEMARALGIGRQTVWPGMLTGDMKWGAFAAAEVFILPSHQENFGIALAEAMACGKAVLTTNKINIWREIQSAGAGCIESDDQDGVNALLARWLSLSKCEREAYGSRARTCFEQRFEASRVAQDYHMVYGSVLYAKKSPQMTLLNQNALETP